MLISSLDAFDEECVPLLAEIVGPAAEQEGKPYMCKYIAVQI